jgi:hypothetical protein
MRFEKNKTEVTKIIESITTMSKQCLQIDERDGEIQSETLALCRVTLRRCQKSFNFRRTHIFGMAFVVEKNSLTRRESRT